MKIACDCSRCREYHKKIIGMTDVNSLNTQTRMEAKIKEAYDKGYEDGHSDALKTLPIYQSDNLN